MKAVAGGSEKHGNLDLLGLFVSDGDWLSRSVGTLLARRMSLFCNDSSAYAGVYGFEFMVINLSNDSVLQLVYIKDSNLF